MADDGDRDVRGTFLDWPALLAVMGVLLAVWAGAARDSTVGVVVGLLLAAFGAVTVLARRGSFSPRRR